MNNIDILSDLKTDKIRSTNQKIKMNLGSSTIKVISEELGGM